MKGSFPEDGFAIALIWTAKAFITVKNGSVAPFSLQDAFYCSWVADRQNEGADILVEVNK